MRTRGARHPNLILAVLALAAASSALQQSLLLPAMPDVQRELGVSAATASWVVSSFLLSGGVATPIAGRLGDMYGKKRVLLVVMYIFAAGTVIAGLATSLPLLCAGRALQGISGGVFPLAFAIVRDELPPPRVAFGVGLLGSMLGVGAGAGVSLAGPIVSGLSYHWLFWLPLVAVMVALVAAHVVVPESPSRSGGRVSWSSAALMSAGLVLLLLALTLTPQWGWTAARTLGLFAAGAGCLAAWLAVEARSDAPLVDLRMLRVRGVWTANVVALMLGIAMYTAFVLIPELVREPRSTGFGLGTPLVAAGLYLLPSTLAMLGAGMLAGRIERRYGLKLPLVAGGILGLIALTMLSAAHSTPVLIGFASAVLGVGFGLAFAAMTTIAVQSVRLTETGVAAGMNHLTRLVGSAFGAQMAATLLDSNLDAGGARTSATYTFAFGLGVLALVGGLVGAALAPGHTSVHRH